MANETGFKSYCWAIGTTSYRTDKFNMSIELQLALLKAFRELPGNREKLWTGNQEFQAEYYEFLKSRGFVKGDEEFQKSIKTVMKVLFEARFRLTVQGVVQ